MRIWNSTAAILLALALAWPHSANAQQQTEEKVCNLKVKIDELRKESSPFGPGLLGPRTLVESSTC